MRDGSTAQRLRTLLNKVLPEPLPLRLRAWDNSEAGPPDAPVLWFRQRRALRRLIWRPDQIGFARAYVTNEIDVVGDLYETLQRLSELFWQGNEALDVRARTLLPELARLGALGPPPRPPEEEIVVSGAKHSQQRDRQAVSHHYNVGNDFYRIMLGACMVYSCGYWAGDDPGYGLGDAQRDKLELICRKLALRPGMRLLDVGCGWGALALHAAREHGVSVVGITLSQEQVDHARKQIANAGLQDQVDIQLQDYRDLDDGPFDAIASVGMAEHVGTGPYLGYARTLHRQLRPGGRLLNHQIAALHPTPAVAAPTRSFIDAYVFPDGELAPLGTTVSLLEQAGFEVRDVEALREHYGRTLRAWVTNLEEGWAAAVRQAGRGRARVWRLYLVASAVGFETGRLGVNQILAVKSHRRQPSGLPATRTWLA